jgi:hypothetical protein
MDPAQAAMMHQAQVPQAGSDWAYNGDPGIGEEILRQYVNMEAAHKQMYGEPSAKKRKGAEVSQLQVEYFSLVPNGTGGECVKLLSENMLQSSAVAAATAIQGLGVQSMSHMHASFDEPISKVKTSRSRTWTKEADAAIVDLVGEYGPKHWSQIAAHIPGRSGKQCRERWQHHLSPDIRKDTWTQEEDVILIAAHRTYGNRWAQIAKLLPGRTDNGIKNRWNTTLRRRLKNPEQKQGALPAPGDQGFPQGAFPQGGMPGMPGMPGVPGSAGMQLPMGDAGANVGIASLAAAGLPGGLPVSMPAGITPTIPPGMSMPTAPAAAPVQMEAQAPVQMEAQQPQ